MGEASSAPLPTHASTDAGLSVSFRGVVSSSSGWIGGALCQLIPPISRPGDKLLLLRVPHFLSVGNNVREGDTAIIGCAGATAIACVSNGVEEWCASVDVGAGARDVDVDVDADVDVDVDADADGAG